MSRRFCQFTLALSTLLLAFDPTARATTFVSITDAELAAQTPVVVEVTVTGGDPSSSGMRPATDFTVQVERALQGTVPGGTLLVRVPGGAATATGAPRLVVEGAPDLVVGERAVLFLAPAEDGSFRVTGLALGVFHEVQVGGRWLAVRDLTGMAELLPGPSLRLAAAAGATGAISATESPRDLAAFTDWIAARAAGQPAATSYAVTLNAADSAALAGGLAALRAAALATPAPPGLPPAASAGAAATGGGAGPGAADAAAGAGSEPLVWTLRDDGQPGWPAPATLTLPGPLAAAATYGGQAKGDARLASFDGETTVLLEGPATPAGDAELADLLPPAPPFRCGAGGVASVSGTWYDTDGRVLGGGVIVAAGASCLLAAAHPAAGASLLLAHELPLALFGGQVRTATVAAANLAGPASVGNLGTALAAAPKSAISTTSTTSTTSVGPAAPAGKKPMAKAAAPALPARGYQPRACGFDLNRNGVFGEAADCHAICNGGTGGLDAGGVLRNQVYISCNTGTDSATCGTPGNPCRTISWAWNHRTSPASANAADILCFRGTCHEESITTADSGRPGAYLKPQSGSEARAFELPTHPTMLVGWDYNHNGAYPPYDTADEAVLDGTGLQEAIWLSANSPNSYVELAHFTVRNYGTGVSAPQTGFLRIGGNFGTASHIYVHDILVQNVNRGSGLDSGNIIFNMFTANTQVQHVAIENVEVDNAGGYLVRGSGATGAGGAATFENGPYRFERISWIAHSCSDTGQPGACANPVDEAHAVGWKLWGYITGIEVLDSHLQLHPSSWVPHPSGFGSTAFVPAQCSRNWTIRNNEIDDFKIALTVQGYAQGFCDGAAARPVDGVLFDHNLFVNTYAPWTLGNNGVVISGGGPNPHTSVAGVVVSNNILASLPGWQGMAYIDAGNASGPDPGSFQFLGNTTWGNLTRPGFGAVTVMHGNSYPAQGYSFHGNVVAAGGASQQNFQLSFAPAAWSADGNVFDPSASYTWIQTACPALPSWQQASQQDTHSHACLPQFVNAAGGDFRIAPGDACAGAAGATGVLPGARRR